MNTSNVSLQRALLLFLASLPLFLQCGGAAPVAPPILLEVGNGRPLVFPPPESSWLKREPLPQSALRDPSLLAVTYPGLDDHGHFESYVPLHISFSHDAVAWTKKGDAPTGKVPVVRVTPDLPGKSTWTSSRTLDFTPDTDPNPDVEYAVEILPFDAPQGRKLAAPFKGTVTFKIDVSIAGKTIHYVPKKGEVRPVYVKPVDEGEQARDIGQNTDIVAIFDQPVDLALAKKLITAKSTSDARVPLTLRHPSGNTFEGEKVDPNFIVLARVSGTAPGTKVELSVASQKASDKPTVRKFVMAKPPQYKGVHCGDDSDKDCTVLGSTVRGPSSTYVEFRFSNPLDRKDIDKHVSISPKPPNFRVDGHRDVEVHGSFAPSTTYTIVASGIKDEFGYALPPVSATFVTKPRSATAILREGTFVLDDASVAAFYATTRNVKRGEVVAWEVPTGDAVSLGAAIALAQEGHVPQTSPTVTIPFTGGGPLNTYSETKIDLRGKLEAGKSYLAATRVVESAANAPASKFPTGSPGANPSVPLLIVAGKTSLGAHVHDAGDRTLVYVYRLASGEAVSGASVELMDAKATTGDDGIAVLAPKPAVVAPGRNPVPRVEAVRVRAGSDEALLPLTHTLGTSSRELYPEFSGYSGKGARVGFLVTDRGAYRPGQTVLVKGFVRRPQGDRVAPVAGERVRVRFVDPAGGDVVKRDLVTSDRGTVATEVAVPATLRTGRCHLFLELVDTKEQLADETLRIAEYEVPRFKVDVESTGEPKRSDDKWRVRVTGKYLFGSPMDNAPVRWSTRVKPAAVNGGVLGEQLAFGEERYWYEERDEEAGASSARTGESAVLDKDGTVTIEARVPTAAGKPSEVVFEADVSDASHRHVSGQTRITRHTVDRYAGVSTDRYFGAPGALRVSLGAVDTSGNPSVGATVEATLSRVEWKHTAEKAESGAFLDRWHRENVPMGSCSVKSAQKPVTCDLNASKEGSYTITSRVDGHDGGTVSFYAWSGASRSGSATASGEEVPSRGKIVPITLDKKSYRPGDTAKVLVQSPFARARAILTMEQGGILRHESRIVTGSSVVFDVPVTLAHAPMVHAAVTLLPLGTAEDSYRMAVTRIPVTMTDAKLNVVVQSDKRVYDAKEKVTITLDVKRAGAAVANADVTLAVVDEGVLRLTSFHAKDPTRAFFPPRDLSFEAYDSRAALFRRKQKAHVPGGGGGEGSDEVDTRKSFVETAAWFPTLTTDKNGRATATFTLPDSLTEFRMMATAVDESGLGGTAESSFTVTRPFLLEPVLPRFASLGDTFEVAAIAHNNTDAPVKARVKLGSETRDIDLPAHKNARVGAMYTAKTSATLTFALEIDGKTRDRVERALRVAGLGTEEAPGLSGAFRGSQLVSVGIPADAVFDEGAKLSLKVGTSLYPELGTRLEYLIDYPHGCVEQTTSGLLPLLAAKDIFPWAGVTRFSQADVNERIRAGVKRLDSMRTSSGWLSYWPGGQEPHIPGTIYAARALLEARAQGVDEPELIDGIVKALTEYLQAETHTSDKEKGTRTASVRAAQRAAREDKTGGAKNAQAQMHASIAEILARAKALPASYADTLWDEREALDASGLASLATALNALEGQNDRVAKVLDAIEAAFDEKGKSLAEHGQRDAMWWGSSDKDRALALLVLSRLRPASPRVGALASALSRGVERNTHNASWSLIALGAYIGRVRPGPSADIDVDLGGDTLDPVKTMLGENKEYAIPLAQLRGKILKLTLKGDTKIPTAFAMNVRYKRPQQSSPRMAHRSEGGVSLYRVYTTAEGKAVDMSQVKAGDLVRVALWAQLGDVEDWRARYLALTDAIPAGFEPVNPDLATVASPPDLSEEHPFYEQISRSRWRTSYVDLRDDRVNIYFDHLYSRDPVVASYLLRATTPGTFTMNPARGELMYEPASDGYSEAAQVTIK